MHSDKTDRRARRLVITPKGREVLTRTAPVWTETHRTIEAAFGTGKADRLRLDLTALTMASEPVRPGS